MAATETGNITIPKVKITTVIQNGCRLNRKCNQTRSGNNFRNSKCSGLHVALSKDGDTLKATDVQSST